MRTAVYTVSEEKCVKLCLPQFFEIRLFTREKNIAPLYGQYMGNRPLKMVRGFPTTKVRGETHRACPFVSVSLSVFVRASA